MKCIIIAAGKGKRIKSVTRKKPKCLLKINKTAIIERQIKFLKRLDIRDIIVVKGFKHKQINFKNIKYFINKEYHRNEQLESLFCARKEFDEELLITFADTIYDFSILKKIFLSKKGDIILGTDKNWKARYKFRYDHPYDQADKVKINKKGQIIKIGKKIPLLDTNAEFIGILKLTKLGCKKFIENYDFISKKKETNKMQIHNFLSILIKNNQKIFSCDIKGKFMEIDTLNDYMISKKMFEKNKN